MAYERTVWKNREVERPRTFEKIENPDGTITLVPAEGNIIEPGTPIVAENMNNIEQGIVDAHDLAEQAFQSASNGKKLVAGAITGKGVPTDPSDTFATMANNINAIETDKTGDATAVEADIRVGKTAYARGNKLVGTIPENTVKQTITTQGGQINLPEGIILPGSYVKAQFANLVSENIKKGVNIGGVVGTYKQIMVATTGDPATDNVSVIADKLNIDIWTEKIFPGARKLISIPRTYMTGLGGTVTVEEYGYHPYRGDYEEQDLIKYVNNVEVFRTRMTEINRNKYRGIMPVNAGEVFKIKIEYIGNGTLNITSTSGRVNSITLSTKVTPTILTEV